MLLESNTYICTTKQNNMETKHTSGEWTQEPTLSSDNRFIRRINDEDGKVIAEVRYKLHATQKENLANAKLIAAAPELLEALQEIMNSPCSKELLIGQRFKAFDAIKKATE